MPVSTVSNATSQGSAGPRSPAVGQALQTQTRDFFFQTIAYQTHLRCQRCPGRLSRAARQPPSCDPLAPGTLFGIQH